MPWFFGQSRCLQTICTIFDEFRSPCTCYRPLSAASRVQMGAYISPNPSTHLLLRLTQTRLCILLCVLLPSCKNCPQKLASPTSSLCFRQQTANSPTSGLPNEETEVNPRPKTQTFGRRALVVTHAQVLDSSARRRIPCDGMSLIRKENRRTPHSD